MKKNIIIKLLLINMVFFYMLTNIAEAKTNFNPIAFEKEILSNGLEVIYNVDRTAPVIATILHYRVGSRDEIPGKTGYAHFFEHLMFEGTKDIERSSIDKLIQEAGGTLNAHTSFDETVFYQKLPANEIKLALWIESQRMRNLLVDSIGVETQRGVVLEELKTTTLNQPYGTMLEKVCANLFPNSTYSWFAIGKAEDVEKATIEDFTQFYNNFYQPNNATLVISGDFNINDVKDYVRQYFEIYPKKEVKRVENFVLPNLEKDYEELVIDEKAQLPGVFIAYRSPSLEDPDYYASILLTDILASGESSRLHQRLVEKEQIAVQTALVPLSLQYSGIYLLLGIPSPGKDYKDVKKLIYEEVAKIVKNGVSDDELEKAKNIQENQFVSGKKNTLEKARILAKYNSYYGNPELINTELDNFLKVTKEDIKRVAKKYFGDAYKVALTYLPKE
ncbi:MAG: insulinase family protein [Ignavibacteria bacterium]|nr:insulinase family protein [Ignavibacteria bacterium]